MDFRSVVLVGLLSGAALLSATSSCSSADPQTINFSERPRGPGEQASGGPIVTPDGGGEGGATDAGVDGATVVITAFTGAKPFNPAGAAVGDSLNATGHNFAGNTPVTNPAGQNCMDCHGAGGGAAAKWMAAGTVYNSAAGTTPLKGVEVRLVDKAGKELGDVYSDAQGNFWFESSGTALAAGAQVGVRNATKTMLMATPLAATDTGCQAAACHTTGKQGRVNIQ